MFGSMWAASGAMLDWVSLANGQQSRLLERGILLLRVLLMNSIPAEARGLSPWIAPGAIRE